MTITNFLANATPYKNKHVLRVGIYPSQYEKSPKTVMHVHEGTMEKFSHFKQEKISIPSE